MKNIVNYILNLFKPKSKNKVERKEYVPVQPVRELTFLEKIKNVATKKNYKVYDDKLNIWFIRADDMMVDVFNDWCFVFWNDPITGKTQERTFNVTTDPGKDWLISNNGNKKGTAILVENQYIDSHRLGTHRAGSKTAHRALVQAKPVKVYRDNTKDLILDLDPSTIDIGIFGINIHRASISENGTPKVGLYSAGCQVFQFRRQFDEFISICENSKQDFFTITLIKESDL